MKANEFIKKHGLSEARIALAYCNTVPGGDVFYKNISINVSELKRLVESHELVEKVGGMDKAKLLLRMRIAAELYDSADEIEKAILDVESCQ